MIISYFIFIQMFILSCLVRGFFFFSCFILFLSILVFPSSSFFFFEMYLSSFSSIILPNLRTQFFHPVYIYDLYFSILLNHRDAISNGKWEQKIKSKHFFLPSFLPSASSSQVSTLFQLDITSIPYHWPIIHHHRMTDRVLD